MVFVCVGNDQRFDLVELVLDWTEVRQDEVNARFPGGWEKHATVND